MSLFSFLRKNKQESATEDSAYYSRAEEDSKAVRSRSRRRAEKGGEGDDPVDPVLPEKKRARRRLIGAVALVLAAVVGLPMILDSEPRPLADDIAIQIPSKDKPGNGAIIRSGGPAVAARVAASAALDPAEEVIDPVPAERAKPAPAEDAHAAPKDAAKPAPEAAKAVPDKLALAKPDLKAEPKADVKADTKADTKASDKHETPAKADKHEAPAKADKSDKADKGAEAARAKALLEGKADPKASDKKNQKFVIQVAALATKEKIDELQGKLKGAGIKSYTEKIATQSGDRTRIRVGPFASKEEAEKVRAKIVKLGLNGTLVPA